MAFPGLVCLALFNQKGNCFTVDVTVHDSVCSFCLCVVCADCLSALPSNPGADELIRVAAPDTYSSRCLYLLLGLG